MSVITVKCYSQMTSGTSFLFQTYIQDSHKQSASRMLSPAQCKPLSARYTHFDVLCPSGVTTVRKQPVTVVFTPHVQERWGERVHTTAIDHALDLTWLRRVYFSVAAGEKYAVPVLRGRFLLYVRKNYNVKRQRHELECISLTPSRFVHTHKRREATLLDVSWWESPSHTLPVRS